MAGARHRRGVAIARAFAIVCGAIAVTVLSAARASAQSVAPAAATTCVACHPSFAKLAGLSEPYLLKQLQDYQTGRRKSGVMAPMVGRLKDGDLRLVAAHFAGEKPAPGRVVDLPLATRGKTLYEEGNPASGVPNCVGCHGPDGGDSPRYPRLAGQLSSYTIQEMTAFKAATRTNDRARVMREIASRMSADEIKAVAEYIAGLGR